jgi:protoheme IX farnesyltransferase
MIKEYYELAKPGIVYGNSLVAGAAFIFGSGATIDWQQFFFMIVGLAFVVASACVFNNYYDRNLDAKMERTKHRALAAGNIRGITALLFAGALGLVGFFLLHNTNNLAVLSALLGFVVYVFLYTPLKPRSGLALFVGAVAGATPPVVGYTAAANSVDLIAVLLFAFLFLWQIPHFLAIARYRYDEYAAGGVPLLVSKPANEQERKRARTVFYLSLVVLLLFCLILILQRWIR